MRHSMSVSTRAAKHSDALARVLKSSCATIAVFWVGIAAAQGTFIPVSGRSDLIYDDLRHVLYMPTTRGTVERYDVAAHALLAPWGVGEILNGGDITPNGQFLYVADEVKDSNSGFLRKVNLNTGAVTNVTYTRAFGEAYSWDVAIMNNGLGFFTTDSTGSGNTPFRQIDLATDSLTVRTDAGANGRYRNRSNLTRGAGRNLMYIQESDVSNGPVHTYDAPSNTFNHNLITDMFQTGFVAAVSRDGAFIASEFGNTSVRIYDSSLNFVRDLPGATAGLCFSSTDDILFDGSVATDRIIAYSTVTWTPLFEINIGEHLGGASPYGIGVMTMSADGQLLFLSTPTGVRMYAVPEPAAWALLVLGAGVFRIRR